MSTEHPSVASARLKTRILEIEVALATLEDIEDLVLDCDEIHLVELKRALERQLVNLKQMQKFGE